MKKVLFGFVLALLSVSTVSFGQGVQVLEMFHGAECPHCHAQMAWLPQLEAAYPALEIKKYEVWHDQDNQALMQKRLSEIGKTSSGVPTNIIGDEIVSGFSRERIVALMEKNYGAPATDRAALVAVEEETTVVNDGEEAESVNLLAVLMMLVLVGGLVGAFVLFTKNKE